MLPPHHRRIDGLADALSAPRSLKNDEAEYQPFAVRTLARRVREPAGLEYLQPRHRPGEGNQDEAVNSL
jgi:hypothetical protein